MRRFERDLDDELRFHYESQVELNLKAGMTPEEARRQAALTLGGIDQIKEDCRDALPRVLIETFLRDVRYGARVLWRSPAFTAVVVLSLALGIGANLAVFGVIDAAFTRPLPVARQGELVWIFTGTREAPNGGVAYPDYLDFRAHAKSLSGLAVADFRGPIISANGWQESVYTEIVSDNYFQLLGVRAAHGRMFTEEKNPPPVIVLGHAFFQSKFGGDPRIVGRAIQLSGRPVTVIGVAPAGFHGCRNGMDANTWLPISTWKQFWPGENQDRGEHWLSVIGRMKPGASVAQVRQEIDGIAQNLAAAYPATNKDRRAMVWSDREYRLRNAGWESAVILALTLCVLLIGAANVAVLLLARGEARRREIAMRQMLGATRLRLVRQLLTESFLLAALGAACGILLGGWLIRLMPVLLPAGFRSPGMLFRLDDRALLFGLLLFALSGVLAGVAPALVAVRAAGDRRSSRPLVRHALVVAQMALSLVLLVCGLLLTRSLWNGMRGDLGFARKNLLVLQVNRPYNPNTERHDVFSREIVEGLRGTPGVRDVALARWIPFQQFNNGGSVKAGLPGARREQPEVRWNAVGPGYFRVLGTRLLRGREFEDRDNSRGGKVVMVNETGARRLWPSEDPVGKRIETEGALWEVVGVARDSVGGHITDPPEPILYFSYMQRNAGGLSLMVETGPSPLAMAHAVRQRLLQMNKDYTVYEVTTMEELTGTALEFPRVLSALTGALCGIALLLAVVGLYGVTSYFVRRRSRDIGIRMALGAQRGDVFRDVLGRGVRLALVGIGVGMAGALAATRALDGMLFGVKSNDPATFAAAAVLLLLVALAASYLPARRATRVDPAVTLRYE